ncbi:hypothetical protein STFE110948_03750 [Streptobacillus felis]|uniref:Lipoprotein n=1 Tax=Streptobacillus felis TaxID=1384509 RepID=A0A7Z0PGB6_9FUSO|nr:hypothetical protein [Streptobacillus felis]NYV28052.1 hypothetical protein [Streptobacillus felis]
MKKSLILISTIFALTSCSSIVNGLHQPLDIRSNSGKEIIVKDEKGNVLKKGKGTLFVNLKRIDNQSGVGAKYFITSGDKTVAILPKTNVLAYIVGNIFVPGGHLIDKSTGAMYDLVNVDGEKVNSLEFK